MIEKERIAAYLFSLEKDMPAFLDELEGHALEQGVPIIRKPTQQLLRFLMAMQRPQQLLEVGTAIGFSGIFMMTFLGKYREDAHLTTIEKVSCRIAEAKENFAAAGLSEKITLLEGDAGEILKELSGQGECHAGVDSFSCKEAGRQYDMIFMDAAKGQYLHFYPYVKKLLKTGGLLVSDNVLQDGTIVESRYGVNRRDRTIHGRMREYLYLLSHDEDFEAVTLPMGDGVTLCCKVR